MAEQDSFATETAELLREQQSAEIVVGLPSYNHVGTIAGVVRSIRQGLLEFFPERKAVIVNVDGGSTDDTTVRLADLQGIRARCAPVGLVGLAFHPGRGHLGPGQRKTRKGRREQAWAFGRRHRRHPGRQWMKATAARPAKHFI